MKRNSLPPTLVVLAIISMALVPNASFGQTAEAYNPYQIAGCQSATAPKKKARTVVTHKCSEGSKTMKHFSSPKGHHNMVSRRRLLGLGRMLLSAIRAGESQNKANFQQVLAKEDLNSSKLDSLNKMSATDVAKAAYPTPTPSTTTTIVVQTGPTGAIPGGEIEMTTLIIGIVFGLAIIAVLIWGLLRRRPVAVTPANQAFFGGYPGGYPGQESVLVLAGTRQALETPRPQSARGYQKTFTPTPTGGFVSELHEWGPLICQQNEVVVIGQQELTYLPAGRSQLPASSLSPSQPVATQTAPPTQPITPPTTQATAVTAQPTVPAAATTASQPAPQSSVQTAATTTQPGTQPAPTKKQKGQPPR